MTLYADSGATEPARGARLSGRGPVATGAGPTGIGSALSSADRGEGFPNRRAPRSGAGSAEPPTADSIPAPSDPLSWVEQLRPAGANSPATRRRPSPLGRSVPVLEALADLSFTEVAVARFARTLFLAGTALALLGWLVATAWAFSLGPVVGVVVLFAGGAAAALALLVWRAALELATLGVRLSDQLGTLQKRAVFERRVFRDR